MTGSLPVIAIGRIVFVRWSNDVTADAVRAAGEAIVTARRAAGARVILVAILPPGFRVLRRDLLDAVYSFVPVIEQVCESQYTVMLGDTFASAILRSSASLFAAILRQPVTITSSIEAALRPACARLGIDPDEVAATARVRGVFDAT